MPSSVNIPESENQLSCVLLKLASSFESRDELRGCFFRRKNERLADVLPRRVVLSPSVISPSSRSSSSTLQTWKDCVDQLFNYVGHDFLINTKGET